MKWRSYPKNKDSGVEWLGEIPEYWEEKRFTFLFSFSRGLSITKQDLLDEGIPCVNYGEIHSKYGFEVNPNKHALKCVNDEYLSSSDKSLLGRGDFVFADTSEDIEGSGNFTCLNSDTPIFAGYHTIIARQKKDYNYRFLSYFFDSLEFRNQIRSEVAGIKVFSVTQSILKNSKVLLPAPIEQTTIANFLDRETARIDTLIEKKERQIEILKEKRVALISHAVTKGLDPHVKMKDSGVEWLGKIPEHWDVFRAKILFKEVKARTETGLEELLTVSHITGVTKRSEKNVNMFMAESLEGYKKCQKNDLVINTMWAWMGALGITPYEGIVSPSYNVYRFRTKNIVSQYFDYLFRISRFISEIICHSQGVWSSRLRLYPEYFFNILLPIPPLDEQRKIINLIHNKTGHFDKLESKINSSISLLHEYRTALISAAVTGKIDVRGVKKK